MSSHNPYQPPRSQLAVAGAGLDPRPFSVGGSLARGASLYVSHFATIGTMLLVVYGPIELIKNYVLYNTDIGTATTQVDTIVSALMNALLAPAIIFAVVETHRTGRAAGIRESLAYGVKRWADMLGVNIVAGVLIFLAALLLVIPGIMVAVWYVAIDPVVALERRGDSPLVRSKAITAGHRWGIFGVFALAYTVFLLLAVGAGLAYSLVDSFLLGAAIDLALDLGSAFMTVLSLAVYIDLVYGEEGGADWLQRVRWVEPAAAPSGGPTA